MKDTLFNITLDNLSGSMMLTLEPKEEMHINQFCCDMMKQTDVYGLLKLSVTTIDGNIKFNYDLSKKKSIAEFAKSGFNESYGRRILYNLCNAFLKLNEYYLKPNYCLLNPEYTYIGDGLNVYLPYIPIKYTPADNDELKNYFSELLSKYFAVEGIAAYDEMFKYVYQCQTLDLSHFVGKFLMSEEKSSNNFVPMNNAQVNQMQNVPSAQPSNRPINQNPQAPIPNAQNPQAQMNPMPNAAPNMPRGNNAKPQPGVGFKLPGFGGIKLPGGAPKAPAGGVNIPGSGPKLPGNMPKMPGGNIPSAAPNMAGGPPKMPGGGGFKMPGAAPKIPSGNMPNANPVPPVQNMNNNRPPVMPVQQRPQSAMDKTIMMDGLNQQMQSPNVGFGGSAYLEYRGQNIPINDSEFVIGKANNQYKINFAINNNPHVSRKHATILIQGNSYFIRDEGSTNGTYVNGRSIPKMMPQPLKNGDEISIYDEVFRFCS